ncbi:MAG: hypothetical protein BM557_05845 [Flavobacterium sp. MedPE-SWcel]|uniref:TlpA disulfide reductase family protein n=1 Tax=uncultured Flavobacterium sp. TaxID=165435 RepID=UPI000917E261|nr:redoxin domain-containing protein [uncultured Flavobacterium sp.]OIQ20190.1 MAG: hypothetical protein BM557_05845 [Flavobacterium sp. MedPE-SWcel]
MKSVISRVGVLVMLLTIVACNDGAKKEGKNVKEKTTVLAPKPIKVYSKDDIKVNAYDYEGLEYFLNRDNDTTYVVNFWATWCIPCVEELPAFEKLNEEYKSDKIKVLLVSLDMSKKVETKLIPFLKGKKLQSDVVLLNDPDANSWISKINSEWSGAIPATLIYNKNKRKFYERSFTYDELKMELSTIK